MVLTSFLDLFQPPSMRISLILHLNFVHIKPQQPNRFDSCTDTASTMLAGSYVTSVANFGDFAPNRRLSRRHWRKIFSLATGDILAIFDFSNAKSRKGKAILSKV